MVTKEKATIAKKRKKRGTQLFFPTERLEKELRPLRSLPSFLFYNIPKAANTCRTEKSRHVCVFHLPFIGEMMKKEDTKPENQKTATASVAAEAPLAGDAPPVPDVAANVPVGNAQQSIDDAEMRSKRAFFGRSAQLAVMAELLHRRINVAIPEVDVGDDIFVVKGLSPQVTRVQVKGATVREQQNSHFVLINVPSDQRVFHNWPFVHMR